MPDVLTAVGASRTDIAALQGYQHQLHEGEGGEGCGPIIFGVRDLRTAVKGKPDAVLAIGLLEAVSTLPWLLLSPRSPEGPG